jgi:hypothetical protein
MVDLLSIYLSKESYVITQGSSAHAPLKSVFTWKYALAITVKTPMGGLTT